MAFVDILLYIWNLFTLWIDTLFVVPVKNTDMLWILVPLWLSWFFGEFFQEKTGTSFGNAISNAVVVLWAGIDCIRQTIRFIGEGIISATNDIVVRFVLCGVLIAYGIIIIIFGTQVKEKVKIFGRIRDVTYAFAILVPVLYNVVPFTTELLLSAIVFFPIFYFLIEFIDLKAPMPKAVAADLKEGESAKLPYDAKDKDTGLKNETILPSIPSTGNTPSNVNTSSVNMQKQQSIKPNYSNTSYKNADYSKKEKASSTMSYWNNDES